MKTAFLFPGQGAQSVGMGADLYQTSDDYRRVFDACCEGSGLNLKSACFEGEGMEDGEVVQPAIFAHSMGLYNALFNKGVQADVYAGLSLGEYSALAAAGALESLRCARLVRERGRIMDAAFAQGSAGMLSVIGLTVQAVEEVICGMPDVYVANHLSEQQSVIAGHMADLLALKGEFEKSGAKMAVLLNVRGPSHAPLLNAASESFFDILKGESFEAPGDAIVYSGALGAPYPKDADVAELLKLQMRSRLRWHDCVEHMIASGVTRFVEVGPSNVLSKMLSRRVGKDIVVKSVRDAKTLAAFLESEGD